MAEEFYWGELEAELRELGLDYSFKKDEDREACMLLVEEKRRMSLYPHKQCHDACIKRGIRA